MQYQPRRYVIYIGIIVSCLFCVYFLFAPNSNWDDGEHAMQIDLELAEFIFGDSHTGGVAKLPWVQYDGGRLNKNNTLGRRELYEDSYYSSLGVLGYMPKEYEDLIDYSEIENQLKSMPFGGIEMLPNYSLPAKYTTPVAFLESMRKTAVSFGKFYSSYLVLWPVSAGNREFLNGIAKWAEGLVHDLRHRGLIVRAERNDTCSIYRIESDLYRFLTITVPNIRASRKDMAICIYTGIITHLGSINFRTAKNYTERNINEKRENNGIRYMVFRWKNLPYLDLYKIHMEGNPALDYFERKRLARRQIVNISGMSRDELFETFSTNDASTKENNEN